MMEAQRRLSVELSAGERLLWSGIPRQGFLLRRSDLVAIPFSLMWGGFAFFWEHGVIVHDASLMLRLWGLPFVAIGVYVIAGRFVHDAWRRARTCYGLTEKRVLILFANRTVEVKSVALRTLGDLAIEERCDGSGSITFGSALALGDPGGRRSGSKPPAFDSIDDVRRVYRLIRDRLEALE